MIEIWTLGRTSVAVNGLPLTGESAWPKSLALIVYMAREPGPDRREEILGVLWPDMDEKRARRALNQLLYTLRKTSPQLDLESISDALDFGKEVWLDVEEFERRFEAGDLKGAVELYNGPFLADLSVGEPEFDHWADRQRAGLRRKYRRAALELAGQVRAAGDHEAAVGYCRLLVDADPLDDEAQHLLIESLFMRGDRLGALRQYERYRDLLARELEVEPLDNTRELIERIRGAPVQGGQPTEPIGRSESSVEEEAAPRQARVQAEPEPAGRAAGPTAAASAAPRPRYLELARNRGFLAIGAVVVILALAIWLWPWSPEGATERADFASGGGAVVAVLPFAPHGLGADDDGLSLGVAQLLALNLDELGGLETVDHRLVQRYWMENELEATSVLQSRSLSSLAGDLGANLILLGDIHASGGELRLVADLLDRRTGASVAHGDVRGAREDLFALLDQLTRSLAGGVEAAADSATGS